MEEEILICEQDTKSMEAVNKYWIISDVCIFKKNLGVQATAKFIPFSRKQTKF